MHVAVPFRWPAVALISAGPAVLYGEVVINSPLDITHRVEVQPIRVTKSGGATANAFGSTANETYIKNQINRIWSQAGVRIDWLPVAAYTDTFTYDGSTVADYTTATRPSNHLNMIRTNTPSPPKSSNPIVLNLFFVQIVPGFPQTSANTSNGLAFIDANGVTVYNGTNLFGFNNGLDVISRVMAHEIGHNLGLDHTAQNGIENLMSSGGSTGRLTPEQRTTVFTDNNGTDGFNLLQPINPSTNYSQWASANNVTGGPNGDDDLDGIRNVIEFMFQKNPKAFDRLPVPARAADGLTWTLPKHAPAASDGLVYRVTTSDNLTTWLPAGSDSGGGTIVQDNSTSLIVRLNSGGARRFMRLDVDIPATIVPAAAAPAARGPEPVPRIAEPVDIGTAYPAQGDR